MQVYAFIEPDFAYNDWRPIEIRKTEEQILAEYYPFWKNAVQKVHKEELISRIDLCIEDWVTVNWAYEIVDFDTINSSL